MNLLLIDPQTNQEMEKGYSDADKEGRITGANELAIYLWDNYIEYIYP